MNDDSIPSPADLAAARQVEHQMQVQLKAATARSPGEWIDIYQSIIENTVRTTLEEQKEGDQVIERLAESRASFVRVREGFENHGLPLLVDLEMEGPEVCINERMGLVESVTWPDGQWIKFHWPGHNEVLEFRGHKALVALSFIMWWSSFQATAQQWSDQLLGKKPEAGVTRQIEPGSPEWEAYFSAKAADIAKGVGK